MWARNYGMAGAGLRRADPAGPPQPECRPWDRAGHHHRGQCQPWRWLCSMIYYKITHVPYCEKSILLPPRMILAPARWTALPHRSMQTASKPRCSPSGGRRCAMKTIACEQACRRHAMAGRFDHLGNPAGKIPRHAARNSKSAGQLPAKMPFCRPPWRISKIGQPPEWGNYE